MDHLTALFQEMWRQGEVPQDFKDATIVHLYKRKGNRQVCDNHRGISLLNIAGKIFARILLNRLNKHLEQGLFLESQCGFRRHRGTTDMIFAARQLQEKCQEMQTHLHSTFVDMKKAFDLFDRRAIGVASCHRAHRSFLLSAMLVNAYSDARPGIGIAYGTEGHILDNRRT
ncbi:hypothetical protein SprV_0501943500 [Sparganum proliferum]